LSSYLAGWLSSLSWIAYVTWVPTSQRLRRPLTLTFVTISGFASAAVLIGTTFQVFLVVYNPNYVPQKWQTWLFVAMIVTFSLMVNTMLARFLPRLEGMIFVLFTLTFLVVEVVLWTLGDRLTTCP
jgi:small basic protein